MAKALEEQWTLPASHSLSFDDRLGLLLDRELTWRDNKRLERLRKQAKLKYSGACLENLDRCPGRGLDERQLATLASGDWIRQHHTAASAARCNNLAILVLGDWALAPLEENAGYDLLEVIDDRAGSQPTASRSLAWLDQRSDSGRRLLDRLVHSAYRIVMKGESLRHKKT